MPQEDCSLILKSIGIGAEPKPERENDNHSYLDDEGRKDVQDPDVQFREKMLSAVSDLGASLRHIRIALSVLVLFVLISLFL